MKAFLSGKKTYILAGLVCLAVLVLVFLGRLTPETALAVAGIALPLFAVTFRAALAAHQTQLLLVLADVAAAGQAAATHNKAGMARSGLQLVQDSTSLTSEIEAVPKA